jgi:hypothetical protein
MAFNKEIFIIGAPRSGTSLLQAIIRSHHNAASVAKESQIIWNQYIHPRLNEWRQEGFLQRELTSEQIFEIRKMYSNYAISANSWSALNKLNLLGNRYMANLARRFYPVLYPKISWLLKKKEIGGNTSFLVDKSVHCALWLNRIKDVFPNVRFIHIVRDPHATLKSMRNSWIYTPRFISYQIPLHFLPAGSPYQHWRFALPNGWENYANSNIETVVAFQWCSIQKEILKHACFDDAGKRSFRVRLEDLVENPKTFIPRLMDFLEIRIDKSIGQWMEGLPKINAGEFSSSENRRFDMAAIEDPVLIDCISELKQCFYDQKSY